MRGRLRSDRHAACVLILAVQMLVPAQLNQVPTQAQRSMFLQFGETDPNGVPAVPRPPLPLAAQDFGHHHSSVSGFFPTSPVSSEAESDGISSWVSAHSQEWQLNPPEDLPLVPCQPDILSRKQACSHCGALAATRGIPSADGDRRWVSFFCRRCADPSRLTNSKSLAGRCVLCTKMASFGPVGSVRSETLHCRRHKLPGEVSYAAAGRSAAREGKEALSFSSSGAERCSPCLFHGCESAAAYCAGEGGEWTLCGEHREVLRVRHRRCEFPGGCDTRPSYGSVQDGVVRYCLRHKGSDDVNLRVRICEEQGCAKQSSFGAPGEPYRYCAEHKRSSDVNTRSGRCSSPRGVKSIGVDSAKQRGRPNSLLRKRSPSHRTDPAARARWEAQVAAEKNVDLMARYVDSLIVCNSQEPAQLTGERELKFGTVL